MAQKSKANLTSTNNLAITDAKNQQNTSVNVRNLIQDIIDSTLGYDQGYTGTTFSGTTNYYSKFNSGGSLSNGIIYDNGSSALFVAPSGNNASLNIVSPAGFYYPVLSFYNTGSNYLGGISAYANSLYISGAGAPITPLLVNSVVQLPYLAATANTLTYVNSANTLLGVTLGSGLDLSTGGKLSVLVTNFTGGTVSGATNFTGGLSANTIPVALITDLSTSYIPYSGATKDVDLNTRNFTTSGITNIYGNINTGFIGSTTRIVEAGSNGALASTRELIDSFLSGGTTTTNLSNVSNWSPTKVYTGTTITGTYQGQQYYDNTYYFIAVDDNTWIRIARA